MLRKDEKDSNNNAHESNASRYDTKHETRFFFLHKAVRVTEPFFESPLELQDMQGLQGCSLATQQI
jgi:hypothetical protein